MWLELLTSEACTCMLRAFSHIIASGPCDSAYFRRQLTAGLRGQGWETAELGSAHLLTVSCPHVLPLHYELSGNEMWLMRTLSPRELRNKFKVTLRTLWQAAGRPFMLHNSSEEQPWGCILPPEVDSDETPSVNHFIFHMSISSVMQA